MEGGAQLLGELLGELLGGLLGDILGDFLGAFLGDLLGELLEELSWSSHVYSSSDMAPDSERQRKTTVWKPYLIGPLCLGYNTSHIAATENIYKFL